MRRNEGFTLLEVVMLLAVLSVIAGVMAPYAAREIDAGRREATQREMEAIGDGLLAYYSDCGRMPDPDLGLTALIENAEALENWNGPYVGGSGNLSDAVLHDAWGELYTYVSKPEIDGGLAVDYLLISGGKDHSIDSHEKAGQWVLATQADIVLQGLTHSIDSAWETQTRLQLQAIEEGLQAFFLDVGRFPAGTDSSALVELVNCAEVAWSGPYVSQSVSDLVRDPWGNAIGLHACTELNSTAVSGWLLLSYGAGAPDARWKGTRCKTGSNDIYRMISADRLNSLLNRANQAEASKELELLAVDIELANPAASPSSYVLSQSDPWGQSYRFLQKNVKSGVIYSVGANGVDDSGGGDDLYESVIWE